MDLRPLAPTLLALFVASCSSSSGSTEEDFSPLYAPASGSPNTKTVFGTWGLSKTDSGFLTEARLKLTPTHVVFANRCSKGSESVIVGLSVDATVTEETISLKQGGNKSANIAGASCRISLTAGDGKLVIVGGQLNLNGALVFDTKLSD
jgi:hypothetical protein